MVKINREGGRQASVGPFWQPTAFDKAGQRQKPFFLQLGTQLGTQRGKPGNSYIKGRR